MYDRLKREENADELKFWLQQIDFIAKFDKKITDKIDLVLNPIKEKYKWILSNSDVNGQDFKNDFFDILYSDFNIIRVNAKRSINTNGNKRGKLTELLISN